MLHLVCLIVLLAALRRKPDLLTPALSHLLGVAFLAGVVLPSWLSFRFFEMPVRFWLRARLDRRPVDAA